MEPLRKLLEMVKRTCSVCSREFEAPPFDAFTLCDPCADLAKAADLATYKDQQRARIPALVDARLGTIGLGKMERRADLDHVPVAIKRVLPRDAVKTLLDGRSPERGFGLVGGQGIGKTMTMAAIVRAGITTLTTRALDSLADRPYGDDDRWHVVGRLRWVSWPTTAAEMKASVARNRGSEDVEDAVQAAIKTPLLIIDDIGRERMRGGYTEDFAVGQLDRIIDARAREDRPILWTANAGPGDLAAIYGGALASRLVGLAPPVELPQLVDLRLAVAGV